MLAVAYFLFQMGYVFFSLLLIIVSFIYFLTRILVSPSVDMPKIKITPGNKTHPPFTSAQEHISKHNRGFGESLTAIGKFMFGGYKFFFGKPEEKK